MFTYEDKLHDFFVHVYSYSYTAKTVSMIFIPNCRNHTKIDFGMIPVAIWYEYHTSVFAVSVCCVCCLSVFMCMCVVWLCVCCLCMFCVCMHACYVWLWCV